MDGLASLLKDNNNPIEKNQPVLKLERVFYNYMKQFFLFLFSVIVFTAISCNNNAAEKTQSVPPIQSSENKDLVIDSTEIILLDTTAENNSKPISIKRTSDKIFIQSLVNHYKEQTVSVNINCIPTYRIYCFINGDVIKTLYISTATNCSYLAYVHNGSKYYTALSDSLKAMITQLVK